MDWTTIVAVVAGLLVVDRVFLWMESRGWIYWRRVKSAPSTNSALLEFQQILQPQTRHVIEARKQERINQSEDGDPPTT